VVDFRSEKLAGELLDPRRGFEPAPVELEIRWDPLTRQSARILPDAGLLPRANGDLQRLANGTRAGCPFCRDRLETVTPKLLPALSESGRICVGEAVLFPNLVPYSKHSSVSVYSPDRHFLPLAELSPRLIADNLATQIVFARATTNADPESRWVSINANHMLPAGSSVFHPHSREASIHFRPPFRSSSPTWRERSFVPT
jgi:UDPglucose--hexose-1-phosphate uridylyltransferase